MLRELSLKAKARRRSSSRVDPDEDHTNNAFDPPTRALPSVGSLSDVHSGNNDAALAASSLRALRASLKAGASATFHTGPPPSADGTPRAPRSSGLAALRTAGKDGSPLVRPKRPLNVPASRTEFKKETPAPAPTTAAQQPISVHVPVRDGPPKRAPGYTYPLHTMAELLAWRPTGALARCVSRTPLPPSAVARYTRSGGDGKLTGSGAGISGGAGAAAGMNATAVKRIQPPRLLLCHDFAGGYPEWEASADGVSGEDCPVDQGMWRFNHWSYVDVFVYFSHYRVSIPPVGYIQAAHRHGALALGTLIFEHEDGLADLKQMLASFRVRAKAATQLATIAKFFGFDGWLVNVEVALQSAQVAGDLVAFIADLTRATRRLVGAASEVIWYDAVTQAGELKWQNELNSENEAFFKAAGAIFTNYHWDRSAPVRSAVKAGPRRTDVFTGIDVHGRNTYGGGGFQTHLALRPIKQSGTSAAVFAPSWTVERCPPNVSDPLELEERFWTGPRGKFGRESIAHYFKERAVITELPFRTNFDPGWGPRTVKNGLVVDERRYFNMSRQEVQPSFMRTNVASGDPASATLCMSTDNALQGSTSVQVSYAFSQSRMMSGSYSVLRLFIANVPLGPSLARSATGGSSGGESRSAVRSASASAAPSGSDRKQPASSLRVAYDYYVMNHSPEAADSFGMVLVLNSPPSAVLLVGERSKWAVEKSGGSLMPEGIIRGSDPTSENAPLGTGAGRKTRSPVRLQILGKFVSCHVVTPSRDELVAGPPASSPGKWYSRVYDLPQPLVAGQRLAEVMVLVGDPPIPPQSVSPSPFATPGASRLQSRHGSRFGSRDVSRFGSRPESRQGSRSTSRNISRRGSRAGSRSNSPPRTEDLLASIDEMSGGDRSFGKLDFTPRMRSSSSRGRRASSRIDKRDVMDSGGRTLDREEVAMGEARGRQSIQRQEPSYRDAFSVAGSLDFSEMQEEGNSEVWSQNTSRAISRLSSRLGTPSGSRSGSRIHSRLISRQGSGASSLSVSRTGSRAGSRFMSPSGTPISGGGGALPMLASALGAGLRSGTATPNGRMSSGSGRLSAAPLRDLKSALINAAGSLAGMGATSQGSEAGLTRVSYCVYLGSVRMEMFEILSSENTGRRSSAGFDNDFFNMEDAQVGASSPFRSSSNLSFGQRRSSRKHLGVSVDRASNDRGG